MAILSTIPKGVKKEITDTWVAETLKLMLLNSDHIPNASTQQFVDDVSANEIDDTGGIYTAGGVAVAGKVSTADGNNYSIDAADQVVGPGASLNYRYGILYRYSGNPAVDPIRAHIDFKTDQLVVHGTTIVIWNVLGIIYVS